MTAIATRTSNAAVAETLALLHQPGDVFEVRILNAGRAQTVSGYFDDCEAAAAAIAKWDGKAPGVYATLNPVDPALLSRAANRLKERARETTTDRDIVRRDWLLIDADSERPSGISATQKELEAAYHVGSEVRTHLEGLGWPAGIFASSGNGVHLRYRVDLPNDDASRDLVQRVLETLAAKFNADGVKIDTSVGNAARIAKIIGTIAGKGDSTPERPHRRSKVLKQPDECLVVGEDLLLAVAGPPSSSTKMVASTSSTASTTSGNDRFDVERFLADNRLDVRVRKEKSDGVVWELAVCPFNPEHIGGEPFVKQFSNGALAAGCQHASCTWDWHALRERFEPGPVARLTRARSVAPPQAAGGALASPATTEAPAGTVAHTVREAGAEAPDETYAIAALDWQTLLRDGVPEVEYIAKPYLPKGARIWAWGPTGSFKSLWALWQAARLSREGVHVSYFSEENPLKEDLRRIFRVNPDPAYFRMFQRTGMNLADPEWVRILLELTAGDEISFFDSLTDLWSGDEKENRDVQQFDASVLKRLQAQDVTPFVVHHTGHPQQFSNRQGATAARGASAFGQKADVVLEFKDAGEGRFTIVYGKCRIGGINEPLRCFAVEDTDDGRLEIVEAESPEELAIQQLAEKMVQAISTASAGRLTTSELRVAVEGGSASQKAALAILEDDSRVDCHVEKVRTRDNKLRDAKVWRPAGAQGLPFEMDFSADGG
jgi:hypothetical protein